LINLLHPSTISLCLIQTSLPLSPHPATTFPIFFAVISALINLATNLAYAVSVSLNFSYESVVNWEEAAAAAAILPAAVMAEVEEEW